MQDALRAYLELALGLTEASRRKAQQVVRDLVGKGEATAAQLQDAASELLSTSQANREALGRLVRYEVDRALGAVGLATSDEVAELTERVRRLEQQQGRPAAAQPAPVKAVAKKAPAGRTTKAAQPASKKTVAKKTATKKTVAKKSATKSATKTAPKKAG